MYSLIKFGLCISMSVLILAGLCRGSDSLSESGENLFAEQYTRKTIYHSPQTPGYTCWVGAWIMPDLLPPIPSIFDFCPVRRP